MSSKELLIKIEPEIFQEYDHLVKQRTYTNANPLVRWLYWRRFKNILDLIDVEERDQVLDFGCGEGAFLPTISKIFKSVIALDLDTRAARETVSKFELTNVNLIEESYEKLLESNDKYDLIIAASVLEHFEELDEVIELINKKLKAGGQFIASVPSENLLYRVGRKIFGFTKPEDHYQVPFQVKNALEKHFIIKKIHYGPVHLSGGFASYVIYHARKKQ